MSSNCLLTKVRQYFAVGTSLLALMVNLGAPTTAAAQTTSTPVIPIQHVIVIIGENRSFDHVYGTYVPTAGQTVSNLLSKGIVTKSLKRGANYALSTQNSALDETTFFINPGGKAVYPPLPAPPTGSAPEIASDAHPAPFQTLALAKLAEPSLVGKYNQYLTTGATGPVKNGLDTRIKNDTNLPSGVFRITPASNMTTTQPARFNDLFEGFVSKIVNQVAHRKR